MGRWPLQGLQYLTRPPSHACFSIHLFWLFLPKECCVCSLVGVPPSPATALFPSSVHISPVLLSFSIFPISFLTRANDSQSSSISLFAVHHCCTKCTHACSEPLPRQLCVPILKLQWILFMIIHFTSHFLGLMSVHSNEGSLNCNYMFWHPKTSLFSFLSPLIPSLFDQ